MRMTAVASQDPASIQGPAMMQHPATHRPRTARARAVRLAVGALVVTLLTIELVLVTPSVLSAVGSLGQSSLAWLATAAVATVASMIAFARVRQRMLLAAGVRVPLANSVAVSYAAGALNTTLPGGGVVSATYTFRRIRAWGAPTAVATWCVAVTGLLATATLSVVGATGVILGGGSTGSFLQSAVEITAVLLLMAGIAYLTSTPERLAVPAGQVLRRVNRLRGRPAETGYARLAGLIDDLRVIRPSRRSWIDAWTLSLVNWVLDVACLAACCAAFGVHVSLPALLITYTAGMAATSLTPVPGGLGVVEAALMLGLTTAGAPWKAALAAVVVYRLLSVGSVALIGWGIVAAQRFPGRGSVNAGSSPHGPVPFRGSVKVNLCGELATVGEVSAGASDGALTDGPLSLVRDIPVQPGDIPVQPGTGAIADSLVRERHRQIATRAWEVMTAHPDSVSPDDTWQQVARTMRRLKAATVPVCDEHGELCGIVDYRDIGLRCLAAGGSPATAASLAQAPGVTIGVNDPVDEATGLMAERRAWLLPVLDGRRLMGVIHYADVVAGAIVSPIVSPVSTDTGAAERSPSPVPTTRQIYAVT